MSKKTLEEEIYDQLFITRGAGGAVCKKPFVQLSKKEKQRYTRIAQAIRQWIAERIPEDEDCTHVNDDPIIMSCDSCISKNQALKLVRERLGV